MKYYRHTMTLREELTRKRRLERVQAGYESLKAWESATTCIACTFSKFIFDA